MNRRMMNWSLRSILVLFLLTSLVLTIGILMFSSSVYRGVMFRNTGYTMQLYASEQEKLLSDELRTIRTSLYALINKEEVIHYLGGNRGYRASNVVYVTSLLSDIPRYVPVISDVLLATSDGLIAATSFNNTDIINFMKRREILSQYKASGQTSLKYYSLTPAQSSEYLLAMAVPVRSSGGVAIAYSTFTDLLENANFIDYPFAILANGNVIYANSDALPDAETLRAYAQMSQGEIAEGSLVRLHLAAVGWDVFVEYPLNAVSDRLESSMTRWNILSILIFVLIEGLLVLAIYKIIVAPIMSLSNQSARITSAGSMLDNPAGGRNEFDLLVRNINDMVVRTNQLTSEIKDAKLRLMEMDITRLREHNMLLQAQINPHFLYNMLECICGMASQEQNYAIRDMTHMLSKLYQYSLRSPDSTLGEELECINMYEKILKLRYDAGYGIHVDVPEDLLLLPLPRMSLEPIVENSVQHGFTRGGTQRFFVRISAAFDEGTLTVLISDNGCGIAPERMESINRDLLGPALERAEGREHIGLHNVNARLRMSYEAGSGLTLSTNGEGGLDVHMRIRYPAADADAINE